MPKEIPSGAIEIQKGLYLYEFNRTIAGKEYLRRELYSNENYCFYRPNDDVTDEDGNLIRNYYQYMSLGINYNEYTHEQLNNEFISISIKEIKAGVTDTPAIA